MRGDEFGVLLRRCSANDALRIRSVIHENIFSYQLEWDGRQHQVGMSVGLALIEQSSEDAETVLRNADSACYSAKAAGGARVHLYAPDENASRAGQAGVLARLYTALEQGQFRLFGQQITPPEVTPLTDAGATPLGLEVWLRLPVANDKVLSPNGFLPLAERHRLAAAQFY
jgi:predicted signal transduction protein with EAL and GGDEF domain